VCIFSCPCFAPVDRHVCAARLRTREELSKRYRRKNSTPSSAPLQDAHSVVIGLLNYPAYSWYAVYDGHGGSFTSKFCALNALNTIMRTREWQAPHTPEGLSEALRKGFIDLDADLQRQPNTASGDDHSGSTGIAVLVTPTHIFCANVGDSRAILVRSRQAIGLSEDHKPYNPAEEARILAAGGTVVMRRVNGDLAVSRALGDFVYKHVAQLPPEKQQVSPEPEVRVEVRQAGDEFIVLACDGIWDVMSNEDVGAFVHRKVAEGLDDLGQVAEALLDDGLEKNSRDNMSAIIVALNGAPRPSRCVALCVPLSPRPPSSTHSPHVRREAQAAYAARASITAATSGAGAHAAGSSSS
jgi:protein phosphatase 1B